MAAHPTPRKDVRCSEMSRIAILLPGVIATRSSTVLGGGLDSEFALRRDKSFSKTDLHVLSYLLVLLMFSDGAHPLTPRRFLQLFKPEDDGLDTWATPRSIFLLYFAN